MSHSFTFNERFDFSERRGENFDMEAIQRMIQGCACVIRATEQDDRMGTDYQAVLDSGRVLSIDAKARDKGCSAYWNANPEVALETWSVFPEKGHAGKVGWTLDRDKRTDLVLFTYDPSDCPTCFLLPFQHLRMAFERHRIDWYRVFPHALQQTMTRSGERLSWRSECVFVPIVAVHEALKEVSTGWFL